jgi:hypothetical protein
VTHRRLLRLAHRVTHCQLLRLAQVRRRLLRLRRASRLVIDYFAYAARPSASARRAARHAARRRLLHLRHSNPAENCKRLP